jgi:hypothetical protein
VLGIEVALRAGSGVNQDEGEQSDSFTLPVVTDNQDAFDRAEQCLRPGRAVKARALPGPGGAADGRWSRCTTAQRRSNRGATRYEAMERDKEASSLDDLIRPR